MLTLALEAAPDSASTLNDHFSASSSARGKAAPSAIETIGPTDQACERSYRVAPGAS